MPWRRYIQKVFTLIEIMNVAGAPATACNARTRLNCDFRTIIKSARTCINQRSNLSKVRSGLSF